MAKKKEEQQVEVVVDAEEAKVKFQEKLTELLALGKKKKNILEYQEKLSKIRLPLLYEILPDKIIYSYRCLLNHFIICLDVSGIL